HLPLLRDLFHRCLCVSAADGRPVAGAQGAGKADEERAREMTGESAALGRVYAARTPEELDTAYAAWAADYDRETIALGYCLPFMIAGWVSRHLPAGAGPLLDAGCGTGLSGPYLAALGYGDIAGLDLSAEMLRLAA